MSTAVERLATVRGQLAWQMTPDPVLVESYSNDVWLVDHADLGPVVLRICWRGNVDRLMAESVLGGLLPSGIGYPEVLGYGRIDSPALTWALTRRLSGTTLAEAWPDLSGPIRREACRQTATMMRGLHDWQAGPDALAALLAQQQIDATDAMQILGAKINPLPLSDVRCLAEAAADVAGVDRRVVESVVSWLDVHRDLLPQLDDPAGRVLHADLHLHNVWWDGSAAALIDFEFARLGPAWVDLARIADMAAAEETKGIRGPHQLLLDCLREDYPELFAVSQLPDRIRACRLAFELRQLLIWPSPAHDAPADHPQVVLIGLLS